MAVRTTRCLVCVPAVLVLVLAEAYESQICSAEKMENITIDISAAFSKGIRGTDPIYTLSQEACVETCCLDRISDGKICNYVIFNTRMKGGSPNCYQFYFPAQESCPVKQVVGLITYRIIEDKDVPKPAATLYRLPHSSVNGSPPSPQAPGTAVKLPFATRDSSPSRTVSAAALHSSAGPIPTSAPDAGKTEAASLQPHKGTPAKPWLLSETGPADFSSLSSTPPSPPASLPNSHLSDGELGLEGFGADGGNDFSLLTHQGVLFAALFLGVLLFFLAVVLIGGKLYRSRQPRRYTRLDYLINDMYTNM